MASLDPIAAWNRLAERLLRTGVAADPLRRERVRDFVAAQMLVGAFALAALPLYLAYVGPPRLAEVVVLAALLALPVVALAVARTGALLAGQIAVAALSSVAAGAVAAATGGTSSPALAWLLLVPAEAALCGDRRAVPLAAGLAGAAAVALAAAEMAGLVQKPDLAPSPVLVAGALLVAIAYAALLALRLVAAARRTEAVAAASDHRYRLFAEAITDIVTAHGPNGDVVFASPAAERLLGLAAPDVLGAGLFRRIHVADRPAFLRALSDSIANGVGATAEFRVLAPGPSGSTVHRWLEMRCRPVRLAAGDTAGPVAVAVARDVTERKVQEEEFRRAREAAEIASHAKTRFLANVSHELRTPLNAIIGFSELLSAETFGRFSDERQREYVRLIQASGEHLLQVVNDILDMSKIESGAFDIVCEPFDVAGLIEGVRRMLAHQAAEGGLTLETEVPGGLPELVADRRACRQILLNLLSNAIKFTKPGGAVRIAARREGDELVLSVRDTGVGIAEKDLPRLGTPFVQADTGYDRRHEGTGLGLSVVKGLVALHGGHLDIESRIGRGTTVTVRLPLGGQPTERAGGRVLTLPASPPPRVAEPIEGPRRAAQR